MSDIDPELRDRAHGALLGLAAGDALGAPLVGLTREQAQIKFATVTRFLGGGLYQLAPGDNTGRIAMTRAAAVALAAGDASIEGQHLERYLEVLALSPPGLGEATRASLENVRDGMTPPDAARAAHETLDRRSGGIGPALRCVPYAIRFRDAPEALIDRVVADAALTHADPHAGAAAAVLALWVRAHLMGETDPEAAFGSVREQIALRYALPDVLHTPEAIRVLPVHATAYAPDVLHAVAKCALPARRAKPAIVAAANEAGAAAALGAATGAVVGARFGARGLPDEWTTLLRGASAWRALADRLLQEP